MTQVPPPPEGRFGKWAYLMWDYVAKNRLGAANAILGATPVAVGTGSNGTFTVSHQTSGVAAGTFGSAVVIPRFAVDALGHLTLATNAGTLGTFAGFNSLVLAGDALGTSTTGTLTAALNTTGVTAATYGGTGTFAQVTVDAKGRITAAASVALAAAAPVAIAAGTISHNTSGIVAGTYGNSTAVGQVVADARGHLTFGSSIDIAFPAARVVDGAAPIVVATSAGTFALSHNTSGVTAGTYGDSTAVSQVVLDARGHVTSALGVAISFPSARVVEGAAPIAVATSVGTFALSHNTSGVGAGTYGAAAILAQFQVDARGHVTVATNAGTLGTMGGFNSYVLAGDVLGTSTTGTLTAALSTTGVTAGTYGGTLGVPRFGVAADGRLSTAANHALEASAPILLATNAGTFAWSHGTSGVAAGTFGNATSVGQFNVDARGHLSSAGSVDITFPAARAVEGVAPIAVATTVGTHSISHNTSGVAAGTFGAAMVTAQLVVDAVGHVTSGANAGTLGTMASFASYVLAGDVLGTSTTGTFTAALSTTGVAAGTYGVAGTLVQLQVDAKGRLTSVAGIAITAILPDNLISAAGTVGSNKSYIVGHRLEISSGVNWEIGSDGIGMIL